MHVVKLKSKLSIAQEERGQPNRWEDIMNGGRADESEIVV
eukprot:CAMPEP_0195024256 /NCGR_PEP_ID=MMETSP0326_2-20130528/44859_1 /TAXON_ID=2866 ORGANISM="Crypthecodinium cohnii, Strain Seligo" /NCGR_SAMPLE_ID=MMETSP0326_2 /ASSEMBLY_ACC=CAM_ASM_000348 /LENGTH=39 /DNA_ID= /DNA_START= /DNA_END= /DNA_ORIENTATION=